MTSILVLAALLAVLLFVLIRKAQDVTAGEALANYLGALVGGRTEESYRYLSSADRARETLADYRVRRSLGSGLIANLIARHVSFSVESVETDDVGAAAVAVITTPDFAAILSEVLSDAGPGTVPEDGLEAFVFVCRRISHFLDRYQGEAIPLRTERVPFRLVREKDGWKIRLPDS